MISPAAWEVTKLKAFVDDKFNITKLTIFLFNPLPDDKILDSPKLKQLQTTF